MTTHKNVPPPDGADGMVTCLHCRETKPASLMATSHGRPRSICKACHAAKESERRRRAPGRPGRHCDLCGELIVGRGPQAILCASCAVTRRARRGRQDSPALNTIRDATSVLPLVRDGVPLTEACRLSGVSHLTVRRRVLSDPAFAQVVSNAREVGAEKRRPPCGTLAKYDRGCRCDACRAATRQASADWRRTIRGRLSVQTSHTQSRAKAQTAAPDRIPHGLSGYLNYLCKCEVCTTAARKAGGEWQRSTNARLLDQARRHNSQWSGPELELASRTDLSASQVAEMVGRTLWAVQTARRRLRDEPSQQWLAGQRSKLHGS
jgi:hypothetical protein